MLEVRSQEQLHAVADPTRRRILSLLRERAASTTELAEALGQPKGTAGHHVKVLEEAKLIRVVRTRKVRAMTESYYGRLARLYRIVADEVEPFDPAGIGSLWLRQAADEVAPDAGKGDDPSTVVVVHARVAEGDARRFAQRLEELASDFQSYDDEDGRVFGFVSGVYATDLRDLPKKKKRSEEAVRALWPSGGLWRHPDFLKLWTAETISQFGTQVSGLALPFVAIVVLDASPFAVAALGTVEFLPFLLFTLPAGVWVDRLRRRTILIVADYGRAALLLSVPIAYAFDALTLPQLFVVGFLVGTFTVFFDVAYQSYLPSLVEREQIIEGNSKLEVSRTIAQISGPGVAGGLIGLITAPYAVLVDAISFFASGAFLTGIRKQEEKPAVPEGGKPRMRTELWEGLQYVVRHPLLRPQAICTGTSNFFSNVMFSIFLVYAVRTLDLSAAEIGIIFTLGSLGGLVGALDVAAGVEALRRGPHHDRDDVHLRHRRLPRPAGAGGLPVPVPDRVAPDLLVRDRRLQHHAGQPAPGDRAQADSGPHELGHALPRLGNDSARIDDGRGAGHDDRAAADAVRRRRRSAPLNASDPALPRAADARRVPGVGGARAG